MSLLSRVSRPIVLVASAVLLNACTTTDTDDYNTCALGVGFVGLGIGLASSGTGAVLAGTAGGGIVGYLLCDEEPPLPEEREVVPLVIPVPEDRIDPDGDDDGDGVRNRTDECPGTPPGVEVDYKGCAKPLVFDSASLGFEFDSVALPADAADVLAPAVAFIDGVPDAQFEIAGHTDSQGSDAYNQRLSERRAGAVFDQLVALGVPAERMTVVGYGESRPTSSNETESGRARNRRVEISLVE